MVEYPDAATEMALIKRTCEAEDAARDVTAPYNREVTAARLGAVQQELRDVLFLQLSLGRHVRMDVVISLRTKLDAVNRRLMELVPAMSDPEPTPTVSGTADESRVLA